MKLLSFVLLAVLIVSGFALVCNMKNCVAQSSTTVGGILSSDTTWTKDNSPYNVTSTVQIPQGVTLTIEPGVTVTFASTEKMFLVNGSVYAHGTAENKIVFDGGGSATFFTVENPVEVYLDLEYCTIKNGSKLWSIENKVHVSLRHSEVINVLSYSNFVFFDADGYIEYNTFVNSGGFYILDWWEWTGKLGRTFYVRNNLVLGNRGYFVEGISNEPDKKIFVNYNSFVDVVGTILRQGGNYLAIVATENYWGTLNTDEIDPMIYDSHDDVSIRYNIDYLPILVEPHPDTPTADVVANFTYSPSVLLVGTEVTFNGSASLGDYGKIVNYCWSFGDGNNASLSSPTFVHKYYSAGVYNVTLTVTDEFGCTDSSSTMVLVMQDSQPPTTTDNYDGRWHSNYFNITLTAADYQSGVAETYYRINNGILRTVNGNGQPVIVTESMNNTLEYWSVDNAGNKEASKLVTGIKLDKSSPLSSVTLNGTTENMGWFTSDVTVTILATDSVSEVSRKEYSLDNQFWLLYTDPFTIDNEGSFIVYFRSIDSAGNFEATKTVEGKMDKTVPLGSVVINTDENNPNSLSVTLTLMAYDSVSGVAQMRLSNNGVIWSDWEDHQTSKQWTLSSAYNETKTVYAQFRNSAGLVSETYSDSVTFDLVDPVADAGQDQEVNVNEAVTFSAVASSDNVGIVSYAWDFGNGATGAGKTTTYMYTTAGTYTVKLTVTDAAGNTNTTNITITVSSFAQDLPLLIAGVAAAAALALVGVFFWKRKK